MYYKLITNTINNQIYFYNSYDKNIVKYEFRDTCLVPIEEIEIVKLSLEEKCAKISFDANIIITSDIIMFWNDKIHVLINDENI